MSTTDYIRITGILEFNHAPEVLDVTYSIEHSDDEGFTKPKIGVITLRLSEVLDIEAFRNIDIETLASCLNEQTLIRERDEERVLRIFHSDGLLLEEWLLCNAPFPKH